MIEKTLLSEITAVAGLKVLEQLEQLGTTNCLKLKALINLFQMFRVYAPLYLKSVLSLLFFFCALIYVNNLEQLEQISLKSCKSHILTLFQVVPRLP